MYISATALCAKCVTVLVNSAFQLWLLDSVAFLKNRPDLSPTHSCRIWLFSASPTPGHALYKPNIAYFAPWIHHRIHPHLINE